MSTKASRPLALTLVVIGLSASCTGTPPSPSQTVCDGISSEVGGCTAERHDFIGTTCDDLAREWGAILDRQVLSILNGPADPDEALSVRLKQSLVIVTLDMSTRLQELGLVESCDIPAFMAAAEPTFTAELRAKVGAGLYDGDPMASYEEWLEDVKRTLRVIDAEESPRSS